jgi:hypothetical protein
MMAVEGLPGSPGVSPHGVPLKARPSAGDLAARGRGWLWWSLVLAVILVAFRLWLVPRWPSIESDESHIAAHALGLNRTGVPSFTLFSDFMGTATRSYFIAPGVVYSQALWFRTFGINYRSGRGFAIAGYALGLLAAGFAGRAATGMPQGCFMGVLLAGTSRVWLARVSSGRPESWQVGFLLVAVGLAIVASRAKREGTAMLAWTASGAAVALAATFWVTGAWAFPGLAVAAAVSGRLGGTWVRAARNVAASALGGLLAVGVWVAFASADFAAFAAHFGDRARGAKTTALVGASLMSWLSKQWEADRTLVPEVPLILLAVLGVAREARRGRDGAASVAVGAWLALLASVMTAASAMHYHRALLVPFLVPLAAVAVVGTSQRPTGKPLARVGVLLLALAAATLGLAAHPVAMASVGSYDNDAVVNWLATRVNRGKTFLGEMESFFAVEAAGGTLLTQRYRRKDGLIPLSAFDYVFVEISTNDVPVDGGLALEMAGAGCRLLDVMETRGRSPVRTLAALGLDASGRRMGLFSVPPGPTPSPINWMKRVMP